MAKKNISPQHFAQIRYTQPGASGIISHALTSLSRESFRPEDILILCIGTDRSTGDSSPPTPAGYLKQSFFRFLAH